MENNAVTNESKKFCASCGKPINPGAGFCPSCGASQTGAAQPAATGKKQETLGMVALFLPLLTAFVAWFWIGSMNLLNNPANSLILLTVGTVALTAVLIAIEASQVGAGGPNDVDKKGRKKTGPVGWFVCLLIIWFVTFPIWMYERSKYGLKNLAGAAVLSVLIFVGVTYWLHSAIETQKAEVRQQLQKLEALGSFFE